MSKKVEECVVGYSGKLKILFMPLYNAELNPEERVWSDSKVNEDDCVEVMDRGGFKRESD